MFLTNISENLYEYFNNQDTICVYLNLVTEFENTTCGVSNFS